MSAEIEDDEPIRPAASSVAAPSSALDAPAGALPTPAPPPPGITIFAPNVLECKLAVCREKAERFERMSFAAMEMTDADVPLLYDVLNHSECDIKELDLSFNRLTDAGLRTLCQALSAEGLMAHQLQRLRVGGNDLSAEAIAEAVALLAKHRPDVELQDEALLKEAVALMHVGKVFDESPAQQAGLHKGDVVLTFGALSYNGKRRNAGFKSDQERQMDILQHFESVEVSLKPLVAGAVDAHGANKKAIDVVVARPGAGHLRATLRPAQWSGAGLLGAKITAVALDDDGKKKKPEPVASKLEAAKP